MEKGKALYLLDVLKRKADVEAARKEFGRYILKGAEPMGPNDINDPKARVEAEKAEYQARYGCGWEIRWYEHVSGADRGYDAYRKDLNTMLYRYGRNTMWGTPAEVDRFRADFDARLREVYGNRYEELTRYRVNYDPRVADLLLQEAVRTGKWKELPDELQWEYADRVDPRIKEEKMAAIMARIEAEQADYRDRYGAGWERKWYEHARGEDCGYDACRKDLNTMLYQHGQNRTRGPSEAKERHKRHAAWRGAYDDRYDELARYRVGHDPRAGDLLVYEAIRTVEEGACSGGQQSARGDPVDPPAEEGKAAAVMAWIEAEKAEYREKYGDDWEREWHRHISGVERWRDVYRTTGLWRAPRFTHRVIDKGWNVVATLRRHGREVLFGPRPAMERFLDDFDARQHELYGDRYKEFVWYRADRDPRLAELLLQDAIRTGRWEELPDDLRLDYLERKERTSDPSRYGDPVGPDSIEAPEGWIDAEKEEYQERYGCDWKDRWYDHISGADCGYDAYRKDLNTMLYRYGRNTMCGPPVVMDKFRKDLDIRKREVYGGQYEELTRYRVRRDPRVADLLLQEAARTGKWKELPDELQCKYSDQVDPRVEEERRTAVHARIEARQAEYREEYGEDWEMKWLFRCSVETPGHDPDQKRINEDIYRRGFYAFYNFMGDPEAVRQFEEMLDTRLREVYGDRYDELMVDPFDDDPRMAELLIRDAIRTGKWEELPDDLRPEYYERRERMYHDGKSSVGVDQSGGFFSCQ